MPMQTQTSLDLFFFLFPCLSALANGCMPVPLSCTATRIFQHLLWPLVLSVSNDAHRFWQGSGWTSSLISSSLKCSFLSPFPTFMTPRTSHDFTSCCHLHPRLWCSCSNVHHKMQLLQFQMFFTCDFSLNLLFSTLRKVFLWLTIFSTWLREHALLLGNESLWAPPLYNSRNYKAIESQSWITSYLNKETD